MPKPILTAKAYTDANYFALEQQHIFSDCWHFAGLTEDLQQPGAYLTVQAGLNNLIVLKNDDGSLSAFHNICRHRGMRLLEGSGQLTGKITCPYHDWSYSQQGQLLSLPKQRSEFSQIDKNCLALKPAKVGIWLHPNIDAIELRDWFAPIERHLAPYQVEQLIESKPDMINVEIAANWKIVVENYIDHYHLAQLHRGTLNMYQHDKAQFGFAEHHFYFWQPLADDYQANLADNAPLPLIIDKHHPKLGAWVPMLFPCTGLSETESSWSVFQIIPLAVNKTKVVIRTKVANHSMLSFWRQNQRSASFWQQKTKAKNSSYSASHPLGSADFLQEDVYVCQQLQKSLTSPYFEPGPSAKYGESPIRYFQQLVQDKISPQK